MTQIKDMNGIKDLMETKEMLEHQMEEHLSHYVLCRKERDNVLEELFQIESGNA